jgi:hypothetical protein
MQPRRFQVAVFSVIVGLGVVTGLARAADKSKAGAGRVVPAQAVDGMVEPIPTGDTPFLVPPGVASSGRVGIWTRMRNWADTLPENCNSCREEYRFLFGSCRDFFGVPGLNGRLGCGCP